MKLKILLLFIIIALIAGCASSKKEVKPGDMGISESPYDESFDPLTLNDDDIKIVSNEQSADGSESSATDDTTQQNTNTPVEMQKRSGFRVQVAATSSLEKATLVQQEITANFTENNLKAYLIFETPLYKVRVGDALDRDEANTIRDFMRENGYKDAFVVPSEIVIPKDINNFEN